MPTADQAVWSALPPHDHGGEFHRPCRDTALASTYLMSKPYSDAADEPVRTLDETMKSREDCRICQADASTLRSIDLPAAEPSWPALTIADLFSGCGGLSLGMQRAAHATEYSLDVKLALDSDQIAMNVYRDLFPTATTICEPIEDVLDGEMDSPFTTTEAELAEKVGRLDFMLGGPPCQGHSNLNNHSRRDDPRNGLYLRMARAAEVLRPSAIIIENVPTVTYDVQNAVQRTIEFLKSLQYAVGAGVVDLSKLGVPQRRRRHIIIALQDVAADAQELVRRPGVPDLRTCTQNGSMGHRGFGEQVQGRHLRCRLDALPGKPVADRLAVRQRRGQPAKRAQASMPSIRPQLYRHVRANGLGPSRADGDHGLQLHGAGQIRAPVTQASDHAARGRQTANSAGFRELQGGSGAQASCEADREFRSPLAFVRHRQIRHSALEEFAATFQGGRDAGTEAWSHRASEMQTINFTVDSELLRELGERLVGRQYIALAELVKNSFDADATRVEIRIRDDSIEVSDNGHGMTADDFASRWMRVGSTHKVHEMTSPVLKRKLTGSKGVGRLAVQFLASELELTSVPNKERASEGSSDRELFAIVDWDTAVQAGDLTQATAEYELREPDTVAFPLEETHGTTVTLKRLKHEWNPEEFQSLAREIWFLQPPFRSLTGTSEVKDGGFEVDLSSPDPAAVALFNTQMARILDLYTSRIVGRLLPNVDSDMPKDDADSRPLKRELALSLELEGQAPQPYKVSVPVRGEDSCLIDSLDFEIRIFTLQYRQPYGIAVQQAREYMAHWGGVHIYDAGFRIPYAGPAADWLRLEFDHAHRLTQSQLLPSDLNVHLGLNHLPTNSRVLGVVNIDTSREARMAALNNAAQGQHLQIQVSRDRLVTNGAFLQLQNAVRFALDYYATRLAARRLNEKASERRVGASSYLVENVWDVLEKHESEIPPKVATELRVELDKTVDSLREQADWTKSQSGLLGAMATVGSTAIAFDHQLNQQLSLLEYHAEALDDIVGTSPEIRETLGPVAASIKNWIQEYGTHGQFSLPLPMNAIGRR